LGLCSYDSFEFFPTHKNKHEDLVEKSLKQYLLKNGYNYVTRQQCQPKNHFIILILRCNKPGCRVANSAFLKHDFEILAFFNALLIFIAFFNAISGF